MWVLKKYNFLNKIRTVEKDLRQLVRHLYRHLTLALTQINKIMLENEMQNIYSELLEYLAPASNLHQSENIHKSMLIRKHLCHIHCVAYIAP